MAGLGCGDRDFGDWVGNCSYGGFLVKCDLN